MSSGVKNDRFSNVNILFQNPEKSSSNQDQSYYNTQFHPSSVQGIQAQLPLSGESHSAVLNDTTTNVELKTVSWYNNPKKRSNRQGIMSKRQPLMRSATSDKNDENSSSNKNRSSSGFDLSGFAASSDKSNFKTQNHSKSDSNIEQSNLLQYGMIDEPPTVSLYDWQKEDEFGKILPLQSASISGKSESGNINSGILGSKSIGNVPNVFDKNFTRGYNAKGSQMVNNHANISKSDTSILNESAVIVFGYPESISNLVITHFSHFGNILEDFEILRSPTGINHSTFRIHGNGKTGTIENENKKLPIFTGDGWVKITYDTPASALRALKESGTVYCGHLIGCIPYSRSAIEQLASIKIEKSEDIGSIDFGLFNNQTRRETNSNGGTNNTGTLSSVDHIGSSTDKLLDDSSHYFDKPHINNSSKLFDHSTMAHSRHKLPIKDGKALFLHNSDPNRHNFLQNIENKLKEQEKKNKEEITFTHKLNNWLFGWDNL